MPAAANARANAISTAQMARACGCRGRDTASPAASAATADQPPTIGCTAVAAPSRQDAEGNRPRNNSPNDPSTSAQANTLASQPPITHSPAAVVCRSASENTAAATSRGQPGTTSGTSACRQPTASISQPRTRPTQAACSNGSAAVIGPISR